MGVQKIYFLIILTFTYSILNDADLCYQCLDQAGRCSCCCALYQPCIDFGLGNCQCDTDLPFNCSGWKENYFKNQLVGKCPSDCIGKDFNKGETCGCDPMSGEGCLCKSSARNTDGVKGLEK